MTPTITHTNLGWPIVTAENCFEIIRSMGIRPWPATASAEPLDAYLKTATVSQQEEAARFGPKVFVAKHHNPHRDEPFNGFRVEFRPVATVFALIEGCIPVTAEWKHGNDRITIVPPSGIPGKAEASITNFAEKMEAVARREWEEETGTKLADLTPLTPPSGLWTVVRNANISYSLFAGEVENPIVQGPTKFDHTEHLKMVLFPVAEWVKLIRSPKLWTNEPKFGLEQCAVEATLLGLMHMGQLSLL